MYGKDDAFAEIEMKEELKWLGGSWRFSADGGEQYVEALDKGGMDLHHRDTEST